MAGHFLLWIRATAMQKGAFESVRRCSNYNILGRICSSFSSTSSNVPKEKVDCVVIGAGVVGIAVAREFAIKGRDVLIVDSGSSFGTVTSSRNSEVIHAGIYYKPNSLKALFCSRGRDLLYKYCSEHDVPHKQIGKLIVATRASEVPKLNDIMSVGLQNGVHGLRMIDGYEATNMEPELLCVKAIFSPATGILDSHSLMLSLLGEAENYGANFSYNTAVIHGDLEQNQIHLHISETKKLENWNGKDPLPSELVLIPNLVVNSAGLGAIPLAKRFNGLCSRFVPPVYYARGCYFTLSKTGMSPFKHLIYPIPEDGGLGVHVTLDMNGQVRFGPNVEWIDGVDDIASFTNKFDYRVSSRGVQQFYPEIRKYYPNLKDGFLEAGYAGIRPKLSGPRESPRDFVIQGEETHSVPGLVNLFGIESPGLTSSLAIAEHIAATFLK